jgi:hypothetical protein
MYRVNMRAYVLAVAKLSLASMPIDQGDSKIIRSGTSVDTCGVPFARDLRAVLAKACMLADLPEIGQDDSCT